MIATLDLRDLPIRDIPDMISAIELGRKLTPRIKSVIISPSQQESVIVCDETLFRQCLKICRQRGQSLREATVNIVVEGCRVEVE